MAELIYTDTQTISSFRQIPTHNIKNTQIYEQGQIIFNSKASLQQFSTGEKAETFHDSYKHTRQLTTFAYGTVVLQSN